MTTQHEASGELPRFATPDFDQHYFTAEQWPQQRGLYEFDQEKGELHIHDPMWGTEIIGHQEGDAVLLELFLHPVFQRLAAIEQLTLPKIYATMPGTFEFTRWEHAWGSVVFVRKMLREAEESGRQFTPQEKIEFQLRTLLSDAGHTAFSHLGDWIKQTFGGTEDDHDLTLPEFLEEASIFDILRQHSIGPARVTMPEGAQDFVERDSPWLCTDRVDYACREISRWIDVGSKELWRNAFYIDEHNQLIMKNKQVADYLTLAFGVMSTEHHVQPPHRLQLQLFADLVKGALLEGVSTFGYSTMHPYDSLYSIDADVMNNIRSFGELNHDLHALMLDFARAQRRIFAWGRKATISRFLAPYKPQYNGSPSLFERDQDQHYPDPLLPGSREDAYSGTCPQNVEFIPVSPQKDPTRVSRFLANAHILLKSQIKPGLGMANEHLNGKLLRGQRGKHNNRLRHLLGRLTPKSHVEDFDKLPHTIDVYLPPLKPRRIDPPYLADDGTIKRVSDDPHMRRLMDEQAAIQKQAYVARIYLAPESAEQLKRELTDVRAKWETAVARPRTEQSRQTVYSNLQILGALAVAVSPDPIRHIHRPIA